MAAVEGTVEVEVGRVGERSRDINCGSGGQASKLAYAQTGAVPCLESAILG